MVKEKEYTSDDILVLTDREHVRMRTELYLGNMQLVKYRVPLFLNNKFEIREFEFRPALYKAWNEIVDNSRDEHLQNTKDNKKIIIEADAINGSYTITDN